MVVHFDEAGSAKSFLFSNHKRGFFLLRFGGKHLPAAATQGVQKRVGAFALVAGDGAVCGGGIQSVM